MKKTKGTGAMLFSMIAVIVIICLFIVAGNGAKKEAASKEIRVGLLLYRGDDTFISTLRSYIEEKAKEYERKEGIKVTLDILDAKSNQNTQNNQVDRMLELGCDALCVNIVDRFAASVVIDKAMAADVPVISQKEQVIDEPIHAGNAVYRMTCVSMGNPHAVVFVENVEDLNLEELGPQFEGNPCFPNRVNTEFIQVLDENRIRMRVWERGSGETFACGTGACAAVVASVLNGFTKDCVTVELLGGCLEIEWDTKGDTVFMTGPAATVFHGEIDVTKLEE